MSQTIQTETTHLVLGSGGVAGIAWMTGLLLALQERGFDLASVKRLVGTSAGSTVAAQISSGTPLTELYLRQTDPGQQVVELQPDIGIPRLALSLLFHLLMSRRQPLRYCRRVGKMAQKTRRVDPEARRAVIAQRLPSHDWPNVDLNIIAIDIATGEHRCFNHDSQVSLVDAVTASCAVPGIWPTVPIGDNTYMDGGMKSTDNTLFAAGADRILVISPMAGHNPLMAGRPLQRDVDELQAQGARVCVMVPDNNSKQAMGSNPLDPASRRPAAEAGYQQGLAQASQVLQQLAATVTPAD